MASTTVGLAIIGANVHIDLASYDRTAASVPIVEDLQKIAALIGRRVGEPPVVKDQELVAREGRKQARVPTVTPCKRERIEQPRQAAVEDGATSRHALWPSAQASQLLPSPVLPTIIRFSCRVIQSPAASLAMSILSSPRGVLVSISSIAAFCRRPANFKRLKSRLSRARLPRGRRAAQADPRTQAQQNPVVDAARWAPLPYP